MPRAHLLIVLYVAGATMTASGIRDRGAPGGLYWLFTGLPVSRCIPASSKNASADGVATSCTSHPRLRASPVIVPIAVAGPAPQTIRDRAWAERFTGTPFRLRRTWRCRVHARTHDRALVPAYPV